jgi:hypothetical protein
MPNWLNWSINNANNPFVPSQWYGSQWGPGEYLSAPIGNTIIEDERNRNTAFAHYNTAAGINPFSGEGSWLERQYGQVNRGLDMARLQNPDLSMEDYYASILPQLRNQYQLSSGDERGENVTRYAKPARTISRGFS